jgi:hypothetical protein
MLRRLFRGNRAQSTAEYGILFAAVIAIAAGALTVSLKNAVQAKHDKSLEYMLKAGQDELDKQIAGQPGKALTIYATGEEVRQTKSIATLYKDEKIRKKGGAEEVLQQQQTETDAISINKVVAGK